MRAVVVASAVVAAAALSGCASSSGTSASASVGTLESACAVAPAAVRTTAGRASAYFPGSELQGPNSPQAQQRRAAELYGDCASRLKRG